MTPMFHRKMLSSSSSILKEGIPFLGSVSSLYCRNRREAALDDEADMLVDERGREVGILYAGAGLLGALYACSAKKVGAGCGVFAELFLGRAKMWFLKQK
jgi:hypothetical protein